MHSIHSAPSVDSKEAERLLSDILPRRTTFHETLGDFLFDDSYQIEGIYFSEFLPGKVVEFLTGKSG